MTIKLNENERLDDLQIKGYQIIQNPEKFCFGMDAVLLSDYAKTKPGAKVLDLGTGTGIIPILMAAKTDADQLVGLEIQPESAEMASRSVELNKLNNRVSIIEGDVKEAKKLFPAASFHIVTSNPPYMTDHHGLKNENTPKAIARHEIKCTLEDIVSAASYALIPTGKFYMIHRPFRLPEIISTMKDYGLEPKRMRLVYPYVDKEPNMVLIEAVKGGKPRMTVEKPLIVYESSGQYTDEIYDIYGYENNKSKENGEG
jgi:tRNA1Val (adenine37-N6)-methyltransferase